MNEDNRFSVYLHRRLDNNNIFYIGSGSKARVDKKTDRSQKWFEIVNTVGFKSEVLIKDLSKKDAREIESLLIEMFKDTLINIKVPHYDCLDISEQALSYVQYDESSSTGLRWIKDSGARAKTGSEAGSFNYYKSKPRRISTMINGTSYLNHRLIFTMHYGVIDSDLIIDHIDGNPFNNKISNLRVVSYAVNSRNVVRNESAHVGVFLSKNENLRWVATWAENYRNRSKSFSVLKYTNEVAFKLACDYRENKIKELNENGAGYTGRH